MSPEIERQLERYYDKADALSSTEITVEHSLWYQELSTYLSRFDVASQRPGNRRFDKDAGVWHFFTNKTSGLWAGAFDSNGQPLDDINLSIARSAFAASKGALRAILDGNDPNLFLASVTPTVALFESMLEKFHSFAKAINLDLRKNQTHLKIDDEYDVQRIVYALAQLIFLNVQSEEPTPKRGGKSGRVDFVIRDVQLFIEIKIATKNNASKLRRQIVDDIDLYRSRPDCQKLLVFIYDPEGLIINPAELQELTDTKDVLVTLIISSPFLHKSLS